MQGRAVVCLILVAVVAGGAGASAALPSVAPAGSERSAVQSGDAAGGAITLESLFSPDADERVEYSGATPFDLTWIDDDHFVWRPSRTSHRWMRGDAENGATVEAVEMARVRASVAALPGLSAGDIGALAGAAADDFARGRALALLNHANDLFLVLAAGGARRLTFDAQPEVGEELSPDGNFVSFVRDYNLHLIEVESGRERQLTTDGDAELFYGRLDWVYQEEIYGRGNFKGYWWSPDSRAIAFLRLDESPVNEFTVIDHMPTRLGTEVTNYPKAGDPNPYVWLGVVPALGGDTVWVDTTKYAPFEHLIVRVSWHPTGDRVVYQVQDREQRWLELNMANPRTGGSTTLLRETTPAFVQQMGDPYWLDDGTFLWFSERSGFKHLYHYAFEGSDIPVLQRQVTAGDWEARALHGVDQDDAQVYFSGTERSVIGSDVYRIGLDGTGLERLSERAGTHSARFNPSLSRYIDTWSDVHTPTQVRLHDADGAEVRVLASNPVPELGQLELGEVEFLQVPARDGFLMEAMVIRPPGFDPTRQYPVLQYNYGGPHAQSVRNAWGGARYLWHQMLAQQGYVIWVCDNRSASGKGIEQTWKAYMQLGVVELRDIVDGIDWLVAQGWADPARIGIWGWSYGGFMAAYALTNSEVFRAGIAGAPVTDWRLYDTIYTERYMRMPQNNPEGYDSTSVLESAAGLHGELLILHGTMDDNVHMQNSIRLIYELQKAGKSTFDFMVFPRSRHGIRDRDLVWAQYRRMTEFILETL